MSNHLAKSVNFLLCDQKMFQKSNKNLKSVVKHGGGGVVIWLVWQPLVLGACTHSV